MTNIGNRIKKARIGRGMSQVELAHAIKVSQPTVANWENASHEPRKPALLRISKVLGTTPEWILSGGVNENDSAAAPIQYLSTPMRHVPIQSWPTISDIQNGALVPNLAYDYFGVSINAKTPFALIANDPAMAAYFPIGALIIFDAESGPLMEGGCYLFEQDGALILRRWQSSPDRLEALPNQSAVDSDFLTQRPLHVARAIMTIRRC